VIPLGKTKPNVVDDIGSNCPIFKKKIIYIYIYIHINNNHGVDVNMITII
jgi:hypothetical protein